MAAWARCLRRRKFAASASAPPHPTLSLNCNRVEGSGATYVPSIGATLCAQAVALRTQAVARRGYPPLQGGLKLTRPQQSACSAFLALCAEVEPPAR